jgi:signal peptidase I
MLPFPAFCITITQATNPRLYVFDHAMFTGPAPVRSRLRATIEGMVFFCILLLVAHTWFVAGLVAPCRVTGGSMAFGLLGDHRRPICPDCGFAFDCDAEVAPPSPRAICPNCGSAIGGVESLPVLSGDRVLVDRSAFQFRNPRRWEVVAFRHPLDANKIVIKRVAGLPGESVQIRHGHLYIDGQIQRKPLDCQRSMAVGVYDGRYSPAATRERPALPPRWQPDNEESLWKSVEGRFMHSSGPGHASGAEPAVDWLVYHNWRRRADQRNEVQECPVNDIMPYNQTLPRREEDVHATSELMLSLHLAGIMGQGKFLVRAVYGAERFQVEIDLSAGDYSVARDGQTISPQNARFAAHKDCVDVLVSLFDRQFLLAIDQQAVFLQPIDDRTQLAEPTSQPFAIGTDGIGAEVTELRVLRNEYYTRPISPTLETAGDGPVRLGDREFFVLGDNSPISEDSRTWSVRCPVVRDLLIGRPLMVIFPTKTATIMGRWQVQVPDLGRIGYIR